MKGVQFLVDESGNKSAVLIDLKKNRDLWEDFYERAVARSREHEPRESLASVKARLAKTRSRAVAPKGNAVKDFRSQIRENSEVSRVRSEVSRLRLLIVPCIFWI